MPRTIASDIGSRTLSIEDAADNWIAGTNALPNGHFGLAMEETPDTYSYAHDRVGDGVAYNFRAGQPRTINFWYRGVEQSATWILGCGKQDTTAMNYLNSNWHFWSSGNSLLMYMSYNSNFVSINYGLASTPGWRMITITWNPSIGTHGAVEGYLNGTTVGAAGLPNIPTVVTPAELSLGAKATLSLSSLSPVATVVAPMELAKLAVFDTVLTAQNVADLYIAMISS